MARLDEGAERAKSKMRILCDVCEKAEATIICSADEAALCSECDVEVHEANKLANKHQRVPLINPIVDSPRCDICQEKTGYFFCMEDRALLCRNCDVSIHTINTISSNHQRFLVTGARVALSALGTPGSPRPAAGALLCPASRKANAMMHTKVLCTQSLSESAHPMTNEKLNARENSDTIISNSGGQSRVGNASRKSSISEFLTETVPGWRVDELLNIPDIPGGYDFGDIEPNIKGDTTNFGDCDGAADTCLSDEEASGDDFHEVPKIPSPPTVSGLSRSRRVAGPAKFKGKNEMFYPNGLDTLTVPDLGIRSTAESPYFVKRRRTYMEI